MVLMQLEKYHDDLLKKYEYWKSVYLSDKSNISAYQRYISYGMQLDSLDVEITKEKIRLNPKYKDLREKFQKQKLENFSIPF